MKKEGVVLGPRKPIYFEEGAAPEFWTDSGKIELYSAKLASFGFDHMPTCHLEELEEPPALMEEAETAPTQLITGILAVEEEVEEEAPMEQMVFPEQEALALEALETEEVEEEVAAQVLLVVQEQNGILLMGLVEGEVEGEIAA